MGSKIPAENMIPLGQPGNEEYDRKVRAKTKGSASPKRKFAQQVRRMKEKLIETDDTKEFKQRLLDIVRNPEASALKIEEVIVDMLDNEDLSHRTKVELIGKMVQAHTAIHGSKSKNVNINLNLDNMIEKWLEKKKMIQSLNS